MCAITCPSKRLQWQRAAGSPQATINTKHTETCSLILFGNFLTCTACVSTRQKVPNRNSALTKHTSTRPQWQRASGSPQAMIDANHIEVRCPNSSRRCFVCTACIRARRERKSESQKQRAGSDQKARAHDEQKQASKSKVTSTRCLSRGRCAQARLDTGARQTRTERSKRPGGRRRFVPRHLSGGSFCTG